MTDIPSRKLRIATWNLQSCQRGIPGIIAQIRALSADVIALQEVDRKTTRSGRVDQAQRIASATGYEHFQFYKATPWDVGEYGLAIISRFPILDARTVRLPSLAGIEPRVMGTAQIASPSGTLSVNVTHLSHRRSESALRLCQIARIHQALSEDPHPKVLAGDFNDTPGSATHREVKRNLIDLFDAAGTGPAGTFPLPRPIPAALRIDYVFASREIRPTHASVVRTRASDHYVLTAEVQCPARSDSAAA
jgi:endonuclease/exonuclease/phosphatase family metal-dependent hydrolase